ncbi:glycosyl hydrolases family 28-domain-containing protein [Xylariaceae sp. FL1272]|nr:glycosyl hydrolases family 28-domain-containing protein [Xylariaceae sp. FL1272]
MRSFSSFAGAAVLLSSPLVLACDNPDTDACAAAFVSNQAAAQTFCASAASAPQPTWASACSSKVKKLTSACECFVTATASATSTATATATATTTKATTTMVTSTTKATTTTQATTTTAAGTGSTCIVTAYASISSAVESCTNIVLSNISAPPSSTIDLQALQTGATVTFAGTTTFGTTSDSDFDPIVISGHSVTITGASGHVIEGNGAAYWDGLGSNGGVDKPNHFIVLKKMYSSKVTNLNIKNWPVHCFYINGNEDLTISGLTLDNSDGDAANDASDGLAAAHNSDGFDISSSDYVTLDSITVYNQDDCVAVTSGTQITVNNMYCSGGHGLSIGSIGGKSNNTVSGVTFSNSVVVNSENGARIKTNSGETGTVEDVTYSNITLSGISDYGIDVQQDYLNGGPTGEPTDGVTISNIQFIDVTGTVDSDAYNYYILCGDDSCSDFTFSGVDITGGDESCNYPSTGCP